MLRAEPLVKIQLLMLASEAPDAALELARFGVFNPGTFNNQSGSLAALPDLLPDSPAALYREAWLEAESRLSKLLEQCGESRAIDFPSDAAAPSLIDLQELNGWLKEVWTACLTCHESDERLQDEKKHLDALEETLSKLERLNVDLSHLLRSNSLLSVNIGSLPANGLKRVSEALSMTRYLPSSPDRAHARMKCVGCWHRLAGVNWRCRKNSARIRRKRAIGWKTSANVWKNSLARNAR
jgi:vacuolar-type H+-ATPase subunit I/STV1